MTRVYCALFALLVLAAATLSTRSASAADEKAGPDRAQLEEKFAKTMSGATLIGRFTTREQEADKPLKEDRYTLGKVYKLPNGMWSLESRIQYGDRDAKLTLALDVQWAGDTPVITLDNVLVPGFGSFTCRVLVYGDEYAGTWSGGDHGGHMFGKITHPDEKAGDK
jgi:hypothetical protein